MGITSSSSAPPPPAAPTTTTTASRQAPASSSTAASRAVTASSAHNAEVGKVIVFYHGGAKQRVRVYPGTKPKVLLRTVFAEFGIDYDKLHSSASFLDGDGVVVAFDPDCIPDETKLFLHFKTQVNAPEPLQSWTWDPVFNGKYCHYLLEEGNTVVTDGYHDSGTCSMPVLIGTRGFPSSRGIHKWRVEWVQEMTYHGAGITYLSEVELGKGSEYGNNFGSCPLFQKTNALGEKTARIVLDTDPHTVTINGHSTKYTPGTTVYPALCLKQGHGMRAKLILGDEA
ncbi:hypothetical protein Pelo_12890 [Pelomyxa schiedti]|nr:hypothetical protein Pelo_12890 [Pelomyxa schiedti]